MFLVYDVNSGAPIQFVLGPDSDREHYESSDRATITVETVGPVRVDISGADPVVVPIFDDRQAGGNAIKIGAYLEQCRCAIDAIASDCRLRFISSGVGQEATYIIKESQAHAFRDAGYPDDLTQYPYVAAEASATGKTPQQAADDLMATADSWNYVLGPQIEGIRRAKKIALESCATSEAMDLVVASARAEFNAVGV